MTDRRYQLDYDRLWTHPPHNDNTPATVRLVVTDGRQSNAKVAVDTWLTSLPAFANDTYGRGGWTVRLVRTPPEPEMADGSAEGNSEDERSYSIALDLTSGGEDVLEGIDAVTTEAYEQIIEGTDLKVSWEQLPRI